MYALPKLDDAGAAGLAWSLLLAAGPGLAALEAEGLRHRDVGKHNFMYDPASGRFTLLDFGLAVDGQRGRERHF